MSQRVGLLGRVLLKQWDDVGVVYHEPSGSTHELDQFGFLLLSSLQARPLTSGELIQRLADHVGVESDAAIGEHLDTYLEQFEKLGIVELLPS